MNGVGDGQWGGDAGFPRAVRTGSERRRSGAMAAAAGGGAHGGTGPATGSESPPFFNLRRRPRHQVPEQTVRGAWGGRPLAGGGTGLLVGRGLPRGAERGRALVVPRGWGLW